MAVAIEHAVLVFDLDRDFVARSDIGNRSGENVRPFLLDEAGTLPGFLRGFVLGLRFGALVDFSLDDPRANMQAQAIDGGTLRQREDIDTFEPGGGVVAEFLKDTDALD